MRLKHYLILTAAAVPLFFWNLGGATLWDIDEGRNCTCSYEMMQANDWIVPTFNGELRPHKPVLLYWLQMIAYALGGVNEGMGRLPSAIAAWLTLFVTYELGRRMFSKSTGLLAGLVAAATPMVIGSARFANPDALLNLFIALTFLLVWIALDRPSAWSWAAAGAASGLAVLAKGPVGIVLPGAIFVAFVAWERRWSALFDRRLLAGIVAFSAVALPWYIAVAVMTRSDFLIGFFIDHNASRFLSTMENHRGGVHYYVVVILVGTMPWSLFLLGTAWATFWSCVRDPGAKWSTAHDRAADRSGRGGVAAYRFLACWVVIYITFFTISATKLPNYVLSAVVPITVLTARFLDRWRKETLDLPLWYLRTAAGVLAAIGVVIAVGIAVASGWGELSVLRNRFHPALAPFAPIGVVFVVAAGLMAWAAQTGRRNGFLQSLFVASMLLLAPLAAWATAAMNVSKAASGLGESLAGRTGVDQRVVVFEAGHLPSLNFYLRRDVIHVFSLADVATHLSSPTPTLAILPASLAEKTLADSSTQATEISRHPDMYRGATIVLLGNPAAIRGNN